MKKGILFLLSLSCCVASTVAFELGTLYVVDIVPDVTESAPAGRVAVKKALLEKGKADARVGLSEPADKSEFVIELDRLTSAKTIETHTLVDPTFFITEPEAGDQPSFGKPPFGSTGGATSVFGE